MPLSFSSGALSIVSKSLVSAKPFSDNVLVIGAGGLGAPVLLYLAAAGVGKIGVVDDDVVDLSNLQRQVIHNTNSIGKSKVESASATIKKINNEINFKSYKLRLTAHNVVDLISDYEIIVDGSDNFETRFLLNDACHLNKKTLIFSTLVKNLSKHPELFVISDNSFDEINFDF